jgi:hypothetical protein
LTIISANEKGGREAALFALEVAVYDLRMIFSENRFTLFRIMR